VQGLVIQWVEFQATRGVAACRTSGVELVLQGHQWDTDRDQLDTHPAGGYHWVALRMAVPLAIGEVSAIPEWELADLSVRLQ